MLLLLVLAPLAARSALTPIVQCGNEYPTREVIVDGERRLEANPDFTPCTLQDMFTTAGRLYQYVIFVIALPLAMILIIIGGVWILTSGGNPGRIQKGQGMIKMTLAALAIIFGAWLAINTLFHLLGFTAPGGSWWSI